MIAAFVLLVGIGGTYSMLLTAQRQTQKNGARMAAANLGREILEQARSMDYNQLTPATVIPLLRTRPGLAGEPGNAGWVIRRGTVLIEVTGTLCTGDDPMDGLGVTPPQNACKSHAPVAGAGTDTNPDDFRRLAFTLSWTSATGPGSVAYSAVVSNPSGGVGPRIVGFADAFPTQITSGSMVSFSASTSPAAAVRWSMDDGFSAGDATGGPTNWTFAWNIGTVGIGSWTVDGTYTANVQPYDARGVPGERRAATIMLNRRAPMVVTGLKGGRSDYSGGVIELEWSPNPERDILGYRVYRTNATSLRSRICPPPDAGANAVVTGTSCTDFNPGAIPIHSVVAVDRPVLGDPASGTREGLELAISIGGLGLRPQPPTGLTGSVTAGRVQLDWQPPAGLPLQFFRIYRDGQRVDRTATLQPTWTDPEPSAGVQHRYAVSAVSTLFNESVPSGEVIVG